MGVEGGDGIEEEKGARSINRIGREKIPRRGRGAHKTIIFLSRDAQSCLAGWVKSKGREMGVGGGDGNGEGGLLVGWLLNVPATG